MKTFNITFIGRTLGAIGIFYRMQKQCQGIDKHVAIMTLYKEYDLYMWPLDGNIVEVLKPLIQHEVTR